MTRWLDPPPVEIPASFADLDLSPLIAQTLVRRGIAEIGKARAFLDPGTVPPVQFPHIEAAVDRIIAAIRDQERICVWGDFDVDGQTSTALLVQCLRAMGADITYYIPVRGREGHGVHVETLTPILDGGVRLLITCDTGITAHEAIAYANSRGVDVVITDHHEPGKELPDAAAIINPKLLEPGHPLSYLAGVGVSYKLAQALLVHPATRTQGLAAGANALLDLVALGLIADVALLKYETRALAQRGITALRTTARIGLRVMAELSGTNLESLTEETIGFTFAPRLNALGRLDDANPAVELLLTHDAARARVLAAQIEGLNAQRRLLTNQVYEAAESQLAANPKLMDEPAIVLSNPNWPGGVVGIVANKLVERYHKPAILLSQSEDGILRGSARSVEGLHITDAIAAQSALLLGFGGHPMAAGLSLQAEKLPDFRKGLAKAIERQLGQLVREEPGLQIDAWLRLDEIDLPLAESLEALAPFGAGNPSLTFASRNVQLRSASTIGKAGEHLRLTVEDEDGNVQPVLWWGGAGGVVPEQGSRFDIAYSVRSSTFRGEKQVTLQFEDFRIVEPAPLELKSSELEVVDYRSQPHKLSELADGTLVWAEGADKAKGRNRFDLSEAGELAIWTTPPSSAELREALERVKPRKVYLFGASPNAEMASEFLSRLAGMAKFIINQRDGKTSVPELAAATAQRLGAVELGLEWLAAGGHISIQRRDAPDDLSLAGGNGNSNEYLQKELFLAVRGVLEETAAYRAHFGRAAAESLLGD